MSARTREAIAAAVHWRVKGGVAACRAKSAVELVRRYREVDCPRCLQSAPYRRAVSNYEAQSGAMADAHARERGEVAECEEAARYEGESR